MTKKIKNIEIVFENLDSAVLEPENVELILEGISEEKTMIYGNSEVDTSKSAKKVSIEVSGMKDEYFEEFHGFLDEPYNMTLYDRLSGKDIVCVCLNYEDGTDDTVYVPYPEYGQYNYMQRNKYEKEIDTLFITIEDREQEEHVPNDEKPNFNEGETEDRTLDGLVSQVEEWSKDKGLDNNNPDRQALKFYEEAGEVASALSRGNLEALKDGIGDTVVTLIILAQQHDMSLQECLEFAYDEIKGRKGKTVNGTFIKEEDLNE
ncbi:DNA binding protein [Staphylococcus phage SA11]|uniref:NTP pyrophosphohydrolase MazG-like domain-containing protein n=1 Tax=Staphylococcus phage SA11 TaxID=2927988 RepID=I7DJR2_9CAUD|nr:DNA binding protein [Staphylococcus phage SA11]APC43050.1 DNA binding protein [Staphylococcus phage StAP1]UVT34805.1 DNA-binding protein [Staphylococcus phage vB_SauM-V1SA20]WCO82466.1 DNA replication/modification protein [Staphylococcus phage PBSA08]WJZ48668.1 DNA binding protein [Staphylococcus phage SAC]BBM81405.1 putative DNA binding protein [Staphylococcus phage KSAP7]BBM81593.1 putative DNA binding protein [Staphylococcus phage KSAP11]BEU75256.1 DNA binding protein [Staphylococcus p